MNGAELERLKRHLVAADRHVADALRHIAQQKRIVAELDRDGHDATTARRVLATFVESLRLQQCGREGLLREIEG